MSDLDALPAGWTVWSDEADRVVLAYRPDVFDAAEFPAACMPTIYLTRGRRNRRPGTERAARPGAPWYVTLFLEPDVEREADRYPDREAAVTGAVDLARDFDAGAVDYRACYQVPREAYLEKLDELTGRS